MLVKNKELFEGPQQPFLIARALLHMQRGVINKTLILEQWICLEQKLWFEYALYVVGYFGANPSL